MNISLIDEGCASDIERWSFIETVPELWVSPPEINSKMAIEIAANQRAGSANTQIYLIKSDNKKSIGFLTARKVFGNSRNSPVIYEVGIIIGEPSARNRGYGVKAMVKLFDELYLNTECNRVQAMVDEDNLPAIKLCNRLGMQKDGVLRKYTLRGGEFRDEVVFSYLRNEWNLNNNI